LSVAFEVMMSIFDIPVEVDPFTNVGILLAESFLCA
jgi:hypothetical protein